MDTIIAH